MKKNLTYPTTQCFNNGSRYFCFFMNAQVYSSGTTTATSSSSSSSIVFL